MAPDLVSAILFATVVAGTPLVLAALGELVTEKAGVLNLGAEGIMSVGAVAAFATPSTPAARCWACWRASAPAWPCPSCSRWRP